jgi:hypothetical protein
LCPLPLPCFMMVFWSFWMPLIVASVFLLKWNLLCKIWLLILFVPFSVSVHLRFDVYSEPRLVVAKELVSGPFF